MWRLAGILFFLCVALTAVPDDIRPVRLSERILVLQRGPWNDMMTVLDDGTGLVVIDTWSSPGAAAAGREIAERTFAKKVSHVINTHHHWDHVFGNQAFSDALIIGQAGVPAAMRRDYGAKGSLRDAMKKILEIDPSEAGKAYTKSVAEEALAQLRLVPPQRLVSRDEEFRIGTLTLFLLPTPGVHSETYMLVHIPELGLLVAPKELGLDRPPKPEDGADIDRIIGRLERIKALGKPLEWALLGHFTPVQKPDLDAALKAWKSLRKKH